jgi:hypothetical protein
VLGAWRQATETEAFGQEEAVLASDDVRSPATAVSGTSLEEADIAIAENLGRRRNDPLVRTTGHPWRQSDHPDKRIIAATSSEPDAKKKSRWARALEYALHERVSSKRLDEFFRSNGGIAGCARSIARIRPRRKSATKDDWA